MRPLHVESDYTNDHKLRCVIVATVTLLLQRVWNTYQMPERQEISPTDLEQSSKMGAF